MDLLVTRYPPGAGIGWHRDAPQFRGISLLTACRMRFRRGQPRAWETAELTLELRSAYVLSGPARTQWQHHIPSSHQGTVVDDVSHSAARRGRHAVSRRTRLTVRVHARAHTERLEWDGPTLQLWVREPPADGRANAAVIRTVARWGDISPSQVAIVSSAAARHKLAEIERQDALPPPAA